MMANLLNKMKAVEVIPERVEIYVDSGVNYYYIPETLTNQLGWSLRLWYNNSYR